MSEPLPKLKYVKFTVAKGQLYAYFNTGRRGFRNKLIYAPLPKFGTDDFYQCYAQLIEARTPPKKTIIFDKARIEREAKLARKAAIASLKRERRMSSVYFIQAPEGQIKIGVTSDLKGRLTTLQVGVHGKLKKLAVVKGGVEVERAYHLRFKAHRLHGEWFWPHPEILAEAKRLRRENKRAGCKPSLKTPTKGAENGHAHL